MKFLIGSAALLLAFSVSAHAKTVRYVFQGPAVFAHPHATALQRMTFGLSEAQASAIRELTSERVNFSNYYSTLAEQDNARLFVNHPNFRAVHALDVPPPVTITAADPEFDGQWWVNNLRVKEAWTHATGKGVTIADCDAGFFYSEPDLLANMLVDLRHDFADPKDPTVVDDGGFTYHGTAVSAIMAGVFDAKGTNGIAFDSKIVPLQNFNYENSKDRVDKEEATAACILHAIQIPGVNIVVLENQTMNGSSETFMGTRDAVRLAIASGVIVVGAGGNMSVELIEEAKDDTGSIIVGAVNPAGLTADFSNYGMRTTIGAYGEQLHTLYGPNGKFGSFGGTSGATPQVAAAVALMKEVQPFLTPQQARATLESIRIVTKDNNSVGGMLDVEKAVVTAKGLPADVPSWTNQQVFRARLSAILNAEKI